jgi:hypothetical protein
MDEYKKEKTTENNKVETLKQRPFEGLANLVIKKEEKAIEENTERSNNGQFYLPNMENKEDQYNQYKTNQIKENYINEVKK